MNKKYSLFFSAIVVLSSLFPSLGGLTVVARAPEPPQQKPAKSEPAGGRTPAKLALLVGINHYKYADRISPLAGSINDVQDMRQVLIGKFEFPPENILVLTDAQATHAAIINAIRNHLIAKARPGDIVVFHYSGHGSEMKDVSGKKPGGMDQTMVPYDSRDPEGKVFDISGEELHPYLVELAQKTKNLTFILDSCHSGTLVRGARVRSIPADTRTPPASVVATTRGAVASETATAPQFAYISAATSRESAFEHFAEGADHGALTYFLTRQLRTAKASSTYRDVMDPVIANVMSNYRQTPSLEGVEADQFVFGDRSSLAGVYVTASPSPTGANRVRLDAGLVQGATVGSVYDIYPPGSKRFASPEKPIAKVRVASVDALTSEAAILSGSKVPPASRAVEREHRYGSLRLRVYIDGLQASPSLQSIRNEVGGLKHIEIVENRSICHLQLRQADGNIQTLGADFTTLSTPVSVSDPAAVGKIVGQVNAWAKWFNVLSIRNTHPEIELQFTLRGSSTRDPMARIGRPDMGVREGETIEASLVSKAERDIYVAIVDLSSDGSISVVYPEAGAKAVLKPGVKFSRSFNTFVPRGRSVVTDVLKVFASYKPIDLRPLTQGPTREGSTETGELDPLGELLWDSVGATRQVMPSGKPMDLGTWTTMQRVLVVRRAGR